MLPAILIALFLQAQTGIVRGQIIVPSVRASDRIFVTLQRSDGPIAGRTYSDTLGNYEFRGLASGAYYVMVSVEGYEDVRQDVAIQTGGIYNTATVNISLIEKTKAVKVYPDGGAAADKVDITELKYPAKVVQDYEKALEESRKGNTAKAAELLASLLKAAPDYYSAHNTLGTIYQKLNRYRDGEAEYRRAHQLNSRVPDPLVNLGSLFIQEAEARTKEGEEVVGKILDDALDILEESIKIKRTAIGYSLLGTAYFKSKFYEEAETNLKHALDLDAHLPTARLMLANLYIRQQQWQNALTHLDAYLTENPSASDHAQVTETRAKVAQRIK